MNRDRMIAVLAVRVFTVIAIFAVLEAVTNAYLVWLADDETFLRYASREQFESRTDMEKPLYAYHRYLGYALTPNYHRGPNRHNALGYRGAEISSSKADGVFRIVCVGGSTTYTAYVDDYRKSYPAELERYLHANGYRNVEVINAGVGSWSSWETLIDFQLRVMDHSPDLVIYYHGINDIHPRLVWPPDAYQGDNSGRRSPNAGVPPAPGLAEYSTLIRIALVRTGLRTSHAALERSIDPYPATYYGNAFHDQKRNGTYPDGLFKRVSAAAMLETNKPIYFERNVRNFIAVAKSRGIAVILATFAYSPAFTEFPRVSSSEYIAAFEEHNRLLEQIAMDSDVYFYDFASEFPGGLEYFLDGRHVNEAGARLKARLFGSFILNNGLIEESEAAHPGSSSSTPRAHAKGR